jgi:hypothetical protein
VTRSCTCDHPEDIPSNLRCDFLISMNVVHSAK